MAYMFKVFEDIEMILQFDKGRFEYYSKIQPDQEPN